MPFLGDSRALEGPGIIPAQDHRDGIAVDARAGRIAVRIVDLREDPLPRHVHDERLQGDIQGLCVWTLNDNARYARECVMWRHAWPAMVKPFGDAATEEPPATDSFPVFTGDAGGPSTPVGGSGGGSSGVAGEISADWRSSKANSGGWSPGALGFKGTVPGPSGWSV